MQVLVVDDDRDVAESIGTLVGELGAHVELAFRGDQAVKRYREEDFDLVIMDVRMPGKDGVEAFQEIIADDPKAKVMMMTGYDVEDFIAKTVDQGALGVLRKPIGVDNIRVILARVG